MSFIIDFIKYNDEIVVIIILGIVALWLIAREIRTWYWKQNEIVKILKDISETVELINEKLGDMEDDEEPEEVEI